MEMTQVIPKNGLLGYFFEENNFQSLLFISNGSFTHTKIQPNLDFVRPEQTVKSVRWLGRIKPQKTGYYLFSSSENNYIVLQIEAQNGDEKRVIDLGERDVMELKADTLYSIRLEYQLESPMHIEDTNLALSWELEGQEQELIPDECMYLPDFTKGSGITNLSSTLFRLEAANAQEDKEEEKCRNICSKFPCASECKKTKCQELFNIDREKCCKGTTYNKEKCGLPVAPPKTAPPKTEPPKTAPPKTEPPKTEPQTLKQYLEQRKKEQPQEIYDYDHDFIPDHLEIHGYTTEFHIYEEGKPFYKAYPWRPEYDQDPRYSNYQKYVSNPFLPNTAGDPYTDLEKAGQSLSIQGKVLEEAYHPLVAACPSAAVFMEDVTISPKITTEMEIKSGVSYRTNYGLETLNVTGDRVSVSQGTHLEFNGDLEGYRKNKGKKAKSFGIHASGQAEGGVYISETLTHSNEQTVTTTSTVQDTHTLSETERTTMNSMDSGNISGVLRYRNMGTAPMEQIKPTLSFISGGTTVTTFTPKQEIDFLKAGQAYPAEHLAGVRISPADLLNGHTTPLTKDQMKELTDGNPIKIQATQITGKFIGTGETPRFKKGELYDWAEILPGITQRTARLVLEIPENMLDRRVAAPSKDNTIDDAQYFTPPLTLEQAIQIAFGAKRNNRGELVLKTKTGMVYNLDRASVNVYVNQETDALIVKELEEFKKNGDSTKSIYDVPLQKEMAILIKPILEINAFLNNGYIYIENQMDESMSYKVWREDAGKKILLKQGVVPSASTIGTGYLCGNPTEELSIIVSRQVSQVIFKGKVSALTGFVNNTLQPIGEAPKMLPLNTWTTNPAPTIKRHIESYSGSTFCQVIMINSPNKTVILPLYILLSNVGLVDYYNSKYVAISEVHYEYTIDHTEPTANKIRTDLYSHGSYTYNYLAPYSSWKGGWGMPPTFNIPIITNKEGEVSVKLKLSLYGNIHYPPSSMGAALDINGQLLYTTEIDFKMGISKQYEGKNPIPFTNPNRSFLVSFYKQSDKIYLFNKNSQSVSYCILNEYKESVWEGTLESKKLIEFTFEQSIFWKKAEYRGDQKKLSDRIIITINQIPIFDGDPKDIPSKESIQGYVSDAIKAHTLDYWHLNSTAMSPSYDSVCFKEINPKFLGALVSYEVKVAGDSIGVTPIRSLELDRKLIINFFDYTSDSNKHPKKGQQVEIIAHDIFGNTTSVFNGTAELSDALWREHYKISEWHKKGNRFDALYLAPIPTVFTENTKSYDIQIGNEITNSVLFERPDNESYIRDQRLKLDFSKKLPQDKLPKLGDSVHLVIHTIENQTVMIDLGKIAESDQPDSINALENTHDITTWTKDTDHYTSVQFNKGSGYITSYVFQVNNRYYGEIPVNQATTELDLSKLDTGKNIRKGDYVEIYAYKKDGEGILIQSRYAGTTGFIGAYPTKEKIQQEYHVTSWSKVTDPYTSFTIGPLSDPIDSYIKKYEGCINNSIINLTPNGLTFAFDTGKGPRHGDTVQLFAYTYSGEKIELWKLPAGAIGTVTDEEVRSIHQLKEWADTNKTIVFDTSKLQDKDPIQAHIKSYTIEVWKGQNTNWETFGNPIQMNAQGQLHLQDCNAKQDFPQSPNAVRVLVNFFEDKRTPIVVMVRKLGQINPPPTQKDIEDKHKDYIWNFDQKKLKSITFPHVDSETASYIASYQVKQWSEQIKIKPFQVDNEGVTVEFDKPIEINSKRPISIGGGKTEERLVNDKFTVLVTFINLDKLVEVVHEMEPQKTVSDDDLKKAHVIENAIRTWDDKNWTAFYFNQEKLQPCLKTIATYEISINEKPAPNKWESKDFSDLVENEVDKNNNKLGINGLPMRFGTFGINYPLPSINDILDVTVTTKLGTQIKVITNYKLK
ncbi:hypothetical protein P4278_32515 [Bacillus thuringiensis]|nr:hypothetical protein [Bacillus thuringiensis]MED2784315.1 hypothetical protein [Bacillus thuringiensis]